MTCSDAYNELCCDTLSRQDAEFIHQHVVDAAGAQEASPTDKPIRLVFSLIGLYLFVVRGFTGREVQLVHMLLGRRKRDWPAFELPTDRGAVTASTVLAAPVSARDFMIREWCRSTWDAFAGHRAAIEHILNEHGITDSRSVYRLAEKSGCR